MVDYCVGLLIIVCCAYVTVCVLTYRKPHRTPPGYVVKKLRIRPTPYTDSQGETYWEPQQWLIQLQHKNADQTRIMVAVPREVWLQIPIGAWVDLGRDPPTIEPRHATERP